MYQQSYADIVADSATDARMTERLALEKAIAMMAKARTAAPGSPEEQEALVYLSQLWAAFIKDLVNPGNDLPAETRASLVRTGLGTLAEVQRIQLGLSRDFDSLIEICGIVRDGLV